MVTANAPRTLLEALILKQMEPGLVPYAGGTDLMVQKKPNARYLFINKVKELIEIHETDHEIKIGAACAYSDLLASDLVPEILKRAIAKVASKALRNLGTMGGNICNASPAGDTLPALYALGASVKLASLDETGNYVFRVLPIEKFITGVRKLDLKENELLEQIILSKEKFQIEYYEKVGARQSEAIAKISFVGLANMQKGKVKDIRIAFGSVGTTVIRNKEFESLLLEQLMDEDLIDQVIENYAAVIHPINDQRSTAVYRKHACIVLLRDFLETLIH